MPRIAIIQASPVFNNLKLTLDKAVELMTEAKREGADIVAFGETWFCGYPAWLD